MTQSVMDYVKAKTFESIIVKELTERINILYTLRNSVVKDLKAVDKLRCTVAKDLKEIENTISEVEHEVSIIMEKIGD